MKKVLVVALSAFALIAAGCAHKENGAGSQTPNRSAGTVVDDATLTAKVKGAITNDVGAATAANVNVTTYRGEVQLSGFVDSQEKANQAAAAARGVSGVQYVSNSIQVKSAASGR